MSIHFTGVVLFDTIEGGTDNLFVAPLAYCTKEFNSFKEAEQSAHELACDLLSKGADEGKARGDESHYDLLVNASNEMLRWLKHKYTLPRTSNHPGGTFVVRIIIAERED
jgi:hypothetical protein